MKRLKPSTPSGTHIWYQPVSEGPIYAGKTYGRPHKLGQIDVVDLYELTGGGDEAGYLYNARFTFLSLRDEVATSCASNQ